MKKTVAILLLCFPLLSIAQGIKFEEGLSWEQVKKKAKTENKYIFVDAYATWCGPCKKMDREVYTQNEVGFFMNDKFISVKVQMDSSAADKVETIKWYSDAAEIMQQYKVASFPTYIFFSPDGRIVHQGMGYMAPEKFVDLSKDALNPSRQYFTQKDFYLNGGRNYQTMPVLARTASLMKDRELAIRIANDYIDNYLNSLSENILFNKENLEFITAFCKSTSCKGFDLFFRNKKKVNQIMGEDYAETFVFNVLTEELIKPVVARAKKNRNREPDWNKIEKEIKKRYGSYFSFRTLIWAKVSWYGFAKNWPKYTKNLVTAIENSSPAKRNSSFFINNYSWFLFERSTKKKELNAAIIWMEKMFQANPNERKSSQNLDTYANLLYKVGRVAEGIEWAEKAVAIEKENSLKYKNPPDTTFETTLQKMKAGQPTWPSN